MVKKPFQAGEHSLSVIICSHIATQQTTKVEDSSCSKATFYVHQQPFLPPNSIYIMCYLLASLNMTCSNFCQNIFLGEDIRKQLPRESAEFDGVNANWKVKFYFRIGLNSLFAVFLTLFLVLMQVIMQRLNKDNNALRGTHHSGDVLYVSVFLAFYQQPISFFLAKIQEIEAFKVMFQNLLLFSFFYFNHF